MKQIFRSLDKELRSNLSFDDKWDTLEASLVTCWERGRELALKKPDLAEKAKNDELPALNWKGGFDKELINKEKFGTLHYLAQWLGLRGEDLQIDPDEEILLQCSRTGIAVTYTNDSAKYLSV